MEEDLPQRRQGAKVGEEKFERVNRLYDLEL